VTPALADVKIIRHARARRLRLRIDRITGQATLTAPPRAALSFIHKFLSEQQNWLNERREQILTPIPYQIGMPLILFGNNVFLHQDSSHRGAGVLNSGQLSVGGTSTSLARRTETALKTLAQQEFTCWANELAHKLGLPPCPVRVKDTRSRWGSCSPRTGINLSWRLIFAPREVAYYVVAHEVAHRVHLNHGPAFWQLVKQLVGEPSLYRQWLTREGPGLFRFGAHQTVASLPPRAA
jgi:predicted metal-dependent hydrolase